MKLSIDTSRKLIYHENNNYKMSKAELNMLIFLFFKRGEEATRDELIAAGWPERVVSTNSVSVAITKIRKIIPADLLVTCDNGYQLDKSVIIELIGEELPSDDIVNQSKIKTRNRLLKLDVFIFIVVIGLSAVAANLMFKPEKTLVYFYSQGDVSYISLNEEYLKKFNGAKSLIQRDFADVMTDNISKLYVINDFSISYEIDCIDDKGVYSISAENQDKARSFLTSPGACKYDI
ncbi:winged helix-turn-helix domain-containing protein [Shewanella gaetbuli]|uniref:Winged helix-turn-helix domain-containing protein n=1 Tax=Shewanella gaetbuli TaxID=220752 RepID=A0A9X2CLB8_9GAMM|nr:winged helix-turn-helix domain-containing protein [Shewanella gaetbuli]MCL1144001.1 winged helix-turn-helix domain-containing protein [Shewanella gaetbuli]